MKNCNNCSAFGEELVTTRPLDMTALMEDHSSRPEPRSLSILSFQKFTRLRWVSFLYAVRCCRQREISSSFDVLKATCLSFCLAAIFIEPRIRRTRANSCRSLRHQFIKNRSQLSFVHSRSSINIASQKWGDFESLEEIVQVEIPPGSLQVL